MRKKYKKIASIGAAMAAVAGVVMMMKKHEENRIVEREVFRRNWDEEEDALVQAENKVVPEDTAGSAAETLNEMAKSQDDILETKSNSSHPNNKKSDKKTSEGNPDKHKDSKEDDSISDKVKEGMSEFKQEATDMKDAIENKVQNTINK